MRTFESAAPVLSAWMARKELTAAELSRRTGIDAGILRKIMTGRARAVSTLFISFSTSSCENVSNGSARGVPSSCRARTCA